MDRNLIAALLATVAVGGLAYVFLYPRLSGNDRAEKRQQALMSTAAANRATGKTQGATRRELVAQSLKDIEAREKARSKLTLDMRIAQAGLSIGKKTFYLFSAVAGLLVALLSFTLTGQPLAAAGGLFAGAVGLPRFVLNYLRKRRIEKFIGEFPNAMDVIVRGVKAGLPLGDCIRIIASEAAEPVRSEFRQIVEAQTLGMGPGEAAGKLYERVPVPETNFFAIVLMIQQKAGGNLAEALGNLSRVLRERRKMRGKISAMSMEAKASAAIIGSLPPIVMILLYLSSPKYIELLWMTETGQLFMLASAFWMFCGIMVMRKMINFDI